jgi:AraC-like DNA-binding protein
MGASLLERSRLNVSQIAQRLGYQSVHLFCRQFKQEYRCSPTEYRRNP